jgi:hypothetical protein
MEAPFRIDAGLQRIFDRGHAFALGLAVSGVRPQMHGWYRLERPGEDDGPPTLTWTIVVSHEVVRPLLMDLMRLLPDMVTGIIELGSRDAFRAVDVYLSREPVHLDRFRGAWDLFEPILLEDATLAVGVNGENPFIEIFIDQDKQVVVHAEAASVGRIEGILRRFNLSRKPEAALLVPEESLERIVTRPVLVQRQGLIMDTDQLLMDLRAAWDLELDIDPDRNLDGQGRNIGRTLWNGVVYMDQEDVAGRREAWGHFWGVAASRREMEAFVMEFIESEGTWELLDILSLDRAAFDDRPEELDDLPTNLSRRGVLVWRAEAAGTSPEWGGDDRF